MLRILITIAALSAALSLPAGALAMNGPGGGSAGSTSPANLLRDGKYLPTPKASDPTTVQVVRVVQPGGFDFADAGIGAAIAAATLALVGALVIALHRDQQAPTARTSAG